MSGFGVCVDCGIELDTETDSLAHQDATLAAATPDKRGNKRSHSIRRLLRREPTRLDNAVEFALQDFMRALENSRDDDGLSDDEIRRTLNRIDLESEWDDYTT